MFMSCEIESGYQFDESCTIDSLCDRQSACICAGRNAMRASLKDDVKNLYLRQKLDYSSIKAGPFSHKYVRRHPGSLFVTAAGDGDGDA
jgi:hypothetical protein